MVLFMKRDKAPKRRHADATKSSRISRADWIAAALKVLAAEGIEWVRVEPMAKGLGVTKGSFYWHFTDRAALYDAMLDKWREIATRAIIARVEQTAATPREKIRQLIKLTTTSSEGARLDIAVRSWANHDDRAANAVAKIDRERLDYVVDLLESVGIKHATAVVRAQIFYLTLIGSFFSLRRGQKLPKKQLWDELERLSVQRT